MFEIAHGVDIYYEKDKYIVFFADGRSENYYLGGLLFEMIGDNSIYLLSDKARNMISCYPYREMSLSKEGITDGFKWLYGTVEDEDLPVSTEIFRSCFNETIQDVIIQAEANTVGEFLDICFEVYIHKIVDFSAFVNAIASYKSDLADDFDTAYAKAIIEVSDEAFESYSKKCSVRTRRGKTTVTTILVTNPIKLLVLEYCRMKKENKVLKQCKNCGRIFIPKKRIDTSYCFMPSLEDPSEICSEIGPQIARSEKRRIDPLEREHNQIVARLANAARRAEQSGISYYKNKITTEMERYYALKDKDSNQGGINA